MSRQNLVQNSFLDMQLKRRQTEGQGDFYIQS